jgi:hypothetical protein
MRAVEGEQISTLEFDFFLRMRPQSGGRVCTNPIVRDSSDIRNTIIRDY